MRVDDAGDGYAIIIRYGLPVNGKLRTLKNNAVSNGELRDPQHPLITVLWLTGQGPNLAADRRLKEGAPAPHSLRPPNTQRLEYLPGRKLALPTALRVAHPGFA